MQIIKGKKKYTVSEHKNYWNVSLVGILAVVFQVPKSICESKIELKAYILTEELF